MYVPVITTSGRTVGHKDLLPGRAKELAKELQNYGFTTVCGVGRLFQAWL